MSFVFNHAKNQKIFLVFGVFYSTTLRHTMVVILIALDIAPLVATLLTVHTDPALLIIHPITRRAEEDRLVRLARGLVNARKRIAAHNVGIEVEHQTRQRRVLLSVASHFDCFFVCRFKFEIFDQFF